MKKYLLISLLLALIVGCSKQTTPTYSNLIDEKSIDTISNKLIENGISAEQVDTFKSQISKFYDSVGTEKMVADFTQLKEPEYDPYVLQDNWNAKNDYIGYNCRITSFTLYKNLFNGNGFDENSLDFLIFDHETLKHDKFSEEDMAKFNTLYQSFKTQNTKDIEVHKATIAENYKKFDFKFKDSNVKLVCVYIHDQSMNPNKNNLFVGHTGILIEEKDSLTFIEKLSFSEPYQVVRFSNLTQLKDYLLNKYDFSEDQPESQPIITLNDTFLN